MWSVKTNNNVIWWRTWKMAMTECSKCKPSTECSDGSSHSLSCMTLHCWAGSNGRIKQLTYYYWFLPPYGNTPPGIRNYSGLSLIWYTVYGRETNYYKKKNLYLDKQGRNKNNYHPFWITQKKHPRLEQPSWRPSIGFTGPPHTSHGKNILGTDIACLLHSSWRPKEKSW